MTATSRLRPISSSTVMGTGAITSALPALEAAEMDYGTFSYSTDEVSTYYADSTLYDGVSYRVF